MTQYFVFAGLFLLAGSTLRAGQVLFGSFYSPFGIFSAVWILDIAAFQLDIVSYVPVTLETWSIIGASCLSFLFGCLLSLRFQSTTLPEPDSYFASEERILRGAIVFLCPLGLAGFVSYLRIVSESVGLRAYLESPYLVRELQSTEAFVEAFATTRPLNYINIANVAFASYWLARYAKKRGAALVRVCGVLGFLTTLGAADRTTPFAAISWAFFAREFAVSSVEKTAKSSLVRIGVLAASLVGLFVVLAEWLGKTIENNVSMQRYVSIEVGNATSSLVMPYVYLTGNIPALQEFMRHKDPAIHWGMNVFLPLLKIAKIFSPTFDTLQEVREYEFIPFAFNTMTWLDSFWLDFGLPGMVIMPLLIGLTFSLVLASASKQATFSNVTLLGLCCYVTIHSPFVNKISTTPTWQFIAMIGLTNLVIRFVAKFNLPTRA